MKTKRELVILVILAIFILVAGLGAYIRDWDTPGVLTRIDHDPYPGPELTATDGPYPGPVVYPTVVAPKPKPEKTRVVPTEAPTEKPYRPTNAPTEGPPVVGK